VSVRLVRPFGARAHPPRFARRRGLAEKEGGEASDSPCPLMPIRPRRFGARQEARKLVLAKMTGATVLGRVKRWLLAMLAREERAARGSGAAAKRRRF
jgi:hypothetical protein